MGSIMNLSDDSDVVDGSSNSCCSSLAMIIEVAIIYIQKLLPHIVTRRLQLSGARTRSH